MIFRVKGSFFDVKVIFVYTGIKRLNTPEENQHLRICLHWEELEARANWNKEMKSPPTTIWCQRDVLLMRRLIFWLCLFIEKCGTKYKVIYKFWKTSPPIFGFIFLTLKTEEQKFSDKGFATRKETPGRFFNRDWLKVAPLQIGSLHLVNLEK